MRIKVVFDHPPLYSVWLLAKEHLPMPSTFQKTLPFYLGLFFNPRSVEAAMSMYNINSRKRYVRKPLRTSFKPICPKEPSDLSNSQYFASCHLSFWGAENSPAPKHIIPNAAITTLSRALLITVLNMNSCAINSTSPVYISMPALILSNTPSTMSPVCDPGEYVSLTPKPTAMDIGVDSPYPSANRYGVHRFDFGHGVAANRDPRPSPSNVW